MTKFAWNVYFARITIKEVLDNIFPFWLIFLTAIMLLFNILYRFLTKALANTEIIVQNSEKKSDF